MPSGPDEMDVAASPSSASPRKSKTKKKKSEPVNLPMPGMLEDLEAPLNPKRARDNASPTLTPTSRGPKPKKARKSLGKGNGESAATPSSTGRKARKSKKEKRKSLKERMERSLIASPKRRDSTVPSSQPPSAMKMEGVEHAADPASSRSEPVQNGDGMVPDSDPTDLPMSQTTPNKVLVPESEDDEEQKASKALGGILDKLREQKEENVAFSEMVRQSKPLEKRAREKRMKKKMEAARERRKKLDEARDEIVPTTSFLTEAEVADSDTEVWLFRMPDNKAVTDKVIGKKISFRERDGQLVEKLSVKIKGNQHLNLGSTSAFGDGSAIAIPCAAGDGSRKLVSVKPTHYASLEYAAPYDPNEKAPPPSPLIYAKEPQGLGPQFPCKYCCRFHSCYSAIESDMFGSCSLCSFLCSAWSNADICSR